MSSFDEAQFRDQLRALPDWKKTALLIVLCERMMPVLRKFSEETGFFIRNYEECLSKAWDNLRGLESKEGYESRAETCFQTAPDTEDFEHPLKSAALNTCLSLGFTMKFLALKDEDDVVEAVKLAHETVFMHVQNLLELRSITRQMVGMIEQHGLMRREFELSNSQFVFLRSLPDEASPEGLKALKSYVRESEPLPA